MKRLYYFYSDARQGEEIENGDLTAIIGAAENVGFDVVETRTKLDGMIGRWEQAEIRITIDDDARAKFDAMTEDERFYFADYNGFVAACERHAR